MQQQPSTVTKFYITVARKDCNWKPDITKWYTTKRIELRNNNKSSWFNDIKKRIEPTLLHSNESGYRKSTNFQCYLYFVLEQTDVDPEERVEIFDSNDLSDNLNLMPIGNGRNEGYKTLCMWYINKKKRRISDVDGIEDHVLIRPQHRAEILHQIPNVNNINNDDENDMQQAQQRAINDHNHNIRNIPIPNVIINDQENEYPDDHKDNNSNKRLKAQKHILNSLIATYSEDLQNESHILDAIKKELKQNQVYRAMVQSYLCSVALGSQNCADLMIGFCPICNHPSALMTVGKMEPLLDHMVSKHGDTGRTSDNDMTQEHISLIQLDSMLGRSRNEAKMHFQIQEESIVSSTVDVSLPHLNKSTTDNLESTLCHIPDIDDLIVR